ncbi:bifunctional sugar phosphate isomerase/epimerase/4-hydroxyphenylpyruvate dioxygenase family protein [Pseudacidovorax intermedius]|uniref:3-dehydroshikimate dehydratase n=1 Tax=Pseudacidovorax intermedius TaxID=433924 RepID=A0A147H1X1_9BURK|nr:sugar phosphate isomerase/epimerase and 4-hydroxyphenylpyruvate domain-containing protein [Pseudacidovorax intermedius]KTT23969.1 4-hydroxyphenylpyruvate dioxygenase [Pseudacidovorax intermedius]
MRRSIATVSLSGTLRQKLEAVAAAGFDGVELFEPDFTHFPGMAGALGRMAADLGLTIDLFQPFRDFEAMPPGLFARSLDRAERKFDLMQAMGAPLMLCCSNTSPLSVDEPELAAEQLHALAERAARRGLRVGFEALAWGRHTARYGQAWDIVRRADHPALGLILDSFHTLSLRDDPAAIADIPGDKIFFLQMADAPLLSMDVLQWARHHRVFPGQGDFDVVGFYEQVLLAGYSGPLSLEIFNDMFRETPNRRTAVDAMRSLLYLESQVRQRLATRAAAARPDARAADVLQVRELAEPPAAPEFAGVAFIEFAADEATAPGLGMQLRQLGFRRAGRHRSKAASLYRQGDIAVIVNAEPASFARSRFELHGPSVCALGLRTPQPQAAQDRAVALRSQRHRSPLGPGEVEVPAIVSPGGNLMHFVDERLGPDGLFAADFVPDEDDDTAPDAGLRRVDHIALGLSLEQYDTWTLFTRAVLGLSLAESQELADPFGLVRSRAAADVARSLRLVLNASLSSRTLTARTVGRRGDGGVHHIAFASDDIFDSVARLRAQGVAFLPISPNYYDDLPTRFDIEPALLARMREAGVLFDRSADGDFLHIYTRAAADEGLFYEVVQRIDFYDGYGAANSAARMAAQAQAQT